jgi:hypothetical protein
MNFAELKEEFYARGTDYLSEDAAGVARAERWLNQAYRQVVNLQPWPFLQQDAAGDLTVVTQLTVPDLRKIRYVTDSSSGSYPGRPLKRVSIDDLVSDGEDLSLSGTPEYYYVVSGNRVSTYPLGSSIYVAYIQRVAPLSGADEPIFDEEYHDVIVDLAMIKAYKDSDNFEAAAALRQEVDSQLAAMVEDYMLDSREVQYIEPTGTDS